VSFRIARDDGPCVARRTSRAARGARRRRRRRRERASGDDARADAATRVDRARASGDDANAARETRPSDANGARSFGFQKASRVGLGRDARREEAR